MTIPLALSLRFPPCAAAVCALAIVNMHAATTQVPIGGDPIIPGSLSDMVLLGNEVPLPGVSILIEGLAEEEVILGEGAWFSMLNSATESFAKNNPAGAIRFLNMLASREGGTTGLPVMESWITGGESSERIAEVLSRRENRRGRGRDADAEFIDIVPPWYGESICSCSVHPGQDFPITVIPEPSGALLGAAGCVLLLRRRRTVAAVQFPLPPRAKLPMFPA